VATTTAARDTAPLRCRTMRALEGLPWFPAAMGLLDLRPDERVLLHGSGDHGHVRAVASLVGRRGKVVVVEPVTAVAEAIAAMALPQVEVLLLAADGSERFGTFDAVLCTPTVMPDWPLGAYAELPRSNLRPGGRLVIDLPGPEMLPDVTAVAATVGIDPERLAQLRGPGDDRLTEVLRGAGLRRVQSVLGSHLLPLESPFDLAEFVGPLLQLAAPAIAELGEALAHRLHGHAACEVLVHRSRVQAMR